MWRDITLALTHPPHPALPGGGGGPPGVKRPECEAEHWPQSSAEVKNTWIYTSTPPYIYMVQCLIS
jgi:hypothetical protein